MKGEKGLLLPGRAGSPTAAAASNSRSAWVLKAAAAVAVALSLLLGLLLLSDGWKSSQQSHPLHLAASAACSPTQLYPSMKTAAAAAACSATTEYLPSDLEQLWVQNTADWEQDFCSHMAPYEDSTKIWLQTQTQLADLQQQYVDASTSPAQVLAQQHKMDPKIYSRFVTTYGCGAGGNRTQHTTWIEPLSHGLRHPNALCGRDADVMDRTYLLPAHRAEHEAASRLGNVPCLNRACQSIFFDLGASIMQPTPDEAEVCVDRHGQGWFFPTYKRQGVTFDRFLLWEAVTRPPGEVFQHVRKADVHKYQYFNIPVTTDTQDPSNPVNILKTIAQPGDFVVFKLDIDNFEVEHAILDAIRADPETLALIDEFYFEEHVNFAPMVVWWGNSVGPDTSLASSYAMFQSLRQKGVRAHSWV